MSADGILSREEALRRLSKLADHKDPRVQIQALRELIDAHAKSIVPSPTTIRIVSGLDREPGGAMGSYPNGIELATGITRLPGDA